MILNAGGSGWGDNSTLTLLWENPDTTVPFESTHIPLNVQDYSELCILMKDSSDGELVMSNIVRADLTNVEQVVCAIGNFVMSCRTVEVTDTGINLGTYNSSSSNCVPYRIYGIYQR